MTRFYDLDGTSMLTAGVVLAVVAVAGAVVAVLLGASLPSLSSRTNTLRMTRMSTAYTRKVPASRNAST